MVTKKCEKCGYISSYDSDFVNKFGLTFCNVCSVFAPNNPEKLDEYVQEKVSKQEIEPFRKYAKTRGELQKKGMIEKASKGRHVSRVPFGYKWDLKNKKIVPAENYQEVEEIFEEFLKPEYSLTRLAKKHGLSINGLKKILRNFAYIGKVKFNGEIHQGNHKPIISSILFNKVQEKLDKTLKKK
ncbi:MAG TPA: recombinase family protein [Candidatus Nanoarchaeia archaeon]|nr:recombinase family protein [Candidatus Nanoarchaeia archaeon]